MVRLKTGTILAFLVLLLTACQSSPRISPETRQLLENVEQRYQSLDQFRFEAVITTRLDAKQRKRTIEIPLTYSAADSGRLRLEVDHRRADLTLVSNGSTTWTYLASANRYTRRRASTLLGRSGADNNASTPTDQQFINLARSLTESYAAITKDLKEAHITGRDKISLGKKTINAYRVEATYKNTLESRQPDAEVAPTQYWIDPETHLVLKQVDEYTLPSKSSDGRVRVRETTRLKDYVLNPSFAARHFTIDLPPDAREVQHLSIGGVGSGGSGSMVGSKAPSFTLPNLKGQQVSLEDFRGQVVLIDFWATWCAPCRRAHPALQSLYEEYKDEGLVVLGINNEGRRTARRYMQQNGYTFPTLLDTTDAVSARYGVSALPNYFVIDRQGEISDHIIGYQPRATMLKALKEAGLAGGRQP